MWGKKTIFGAGLFLFLSIAMIPSNVLAQSDYTFVEPLPGFSNTISQSGIFSNYLSRVFTISIGLAAILATLMIVVGGIQRVTAYDNPGKKGEANERITNAVLGLLLVLSAWLILYTINPDLIRLDLVIPAIGVAAPTGGPGPGPIPEPATPAEYIYYTDEDQVRATLGGFGIGINNAQPCPVNVTYQQYRINEGSGCTSVGTLPGNAQFRLRFLKLQCGCSVIITGGTESGHITHGQAQPVVDLRPNSTLDDWIVSNQTSSGTNSAGYRYYDLSIGRFTLETAGDVHWHVNLE